MDRRAAVARDELPGLQLSWYDGDVVAWQPGRSVYGGNLQETVASTLRRATSAAGASMRVVRLHLPAGEQSVMCQRLDQRAIASLAELDVLRGHVSPSVNWFGAMYALADELVRAGRVVPRVERPRPGWWAATWQPLPSDLAAVGAPAAAAMPPVVAAADPGAAALQITQRVVAAFVDHVARHRLASRGWAAELGDTRRVTSRAIRLVSRALTAPTADFRADGELTASLERLSTMLDDMRCRAEGEPVVRVRLRLGLPDPGDVTEADAVEGDDGGGVRWPLTMELVDADDRSRWCTVDDLDEMRPAAMDLSDSGRYAAHLSRRVNDALDMLHASVPWLGPWLDDRRRGLSLDHAAVLLEHVDALEDLGVDVVVPDLLTRRRPTSRGVATPGDDRPGRFDATAIVQWEAVVDDVPVDEAVLQRAAEAGATLVEIGGRWVHLDRRDARRALANLVAHRSEHSEMTVLELLRLSAETNAELVAPTDDGGIAAQLAADDQARLVATGWLGQLVDGLPDAALADGEVPPGFAATLRPYQLRGLGWLQFLRRLGLGGCLADDMGLGKTPTTLAHLAGLPGPHLVVCPLSVVHNWESEAARFVPLSRVVVHHGGGRHSAERFHALAAANDIIVTTYQVVARDIDDLAAVSWSTVVLDEAQAIKNPDTRSAKAVRRLRADQHLALTGTPVENRLSELWSIFAFAVPGLLGSLHQFRARFAAPIERNHDPVAAAALRKLTSPFLLRRTKADRSLVPDLPDKVEQVAFATLTREQATMYQAVVDQMLQDAAAESGMRRRGLVLAALTRLKQICNHPAHALGDGSRLAGRSGKLARFDELVTDLLEAEEQALVFTQFREMGLLLQQHLRDRLGHTVPFLHGGVSKVARQQMVSRFQSGAASPLLLVSLKAGGTGLNLTAASRVVHYDRWWNPAVEDQATDRAWRIGQQRSVFVHKLVVEGTIEEKVDALIDDKRSLASAVVGTTGEAWLSELSTDELRDLVMLDRSVEVRG